MNKPETDFFFYAPAAFPTFRFRLISDGNGVAIVYQRCDVTPPPPLTICNCYTKLPDDLKADPTVCDHFQRWIWR
jgi:hypothetical protein